MPNEARDGLIPYLVYPIGFVAVIIGRAQLFTENTLYPVVLVLDERRPVVKTLCPWAVVFASNIFGAFLFALLAVKSSALHSDVVSQLIQLDQEAASGAASHLFWSGIIGGWMVALVAWTVTASQWTIGQLAMIYLLTFVVGIGRFAHCVAGSCEVLSVVSAGMLPLSAYFHWIFPVISGNICGGRIYRQPA